MKEKVLLIVESPAKIKTIKKYLPTDKEYFVLASVGHIADLSKKHYNSLGVDVAKNFKPHFVTNKDKIDIMQSILDASFIADKILLCTDPDREGEAISYHIHQRIVHLKKNIKRVELHELTKSGISLGLSKEREIDYNLVDAAIARRALDRIVGFMCSPLVIRRLGKGTSAGRVQSVALRMVVEREEEITKFKPEEYWNIKVELFKFANEPFFVSLANKDTIKNKEEADSIINELKKSSYNVSKIIAKPKKRYPYPPLTTARLQMAASSRFGISSNKTMKIAQDLYQDGKVTYIRTDSVRLSAEAIDMAREWILTNHANHLPDKPVLYKNKDAAQDAHEAIRPTDINNLPSDAKNDEDRIYKLIWDYFVASQMKPAVYDTTSVVINTDKKRILKVSGRVLKEAGWLCLLGAEDDDTDNDKETRLPILVVGDVLNIGKKGVMGEQKFTQPPPRYKEHSLVKELESRGIGRPSTYATIMKTICETRNFVDVDKKKTLVPTKKGTMVVDLLKNKFVFMEYSYTAELEGNLDMISAGKIKYVDLMNTFFSSFKKELDLAYTDSATKTDKVCNKCGKNMVLKTSSLGYFLGCSDYPKCVNVIPCEVKNDEIIITDSSTKRHEEAPSNIKCPKCGGKMLIREGKFGKFYSCAAYPDCKGNSKIPYGKKCPNCDNELFRTIFRQGPVLCCMGYPGCRYIEHLKEPGFESKQKNFMKHINENTKRLKTTKVVNE